MRCTFLANCGVLIEHAGESVLVDAPNGLHTLFDGVPAEEHQKMVDAARPYEGLRALFFTHMHADHYDKKRTREITQARADVISYVTNGATPKEGKIDIGTFCVRYFDIPHSGIEFMDVPHRTLLVEAGGKRIYITGDARWDSPFHSEILKAFSPDAAFWNPNYLSHEEGRTLMRLVGRNFLYHMPVIAGDTFGVGRKCRHDFKRYSDILPITLVDAYPTTIEI